MALAVFFPAWIFVPTFSWPSYPPSAPPMPAEPPPFPPPPPPPAPTMPPPAALRNGLSTEDTALILQVAFTYIGILVGGIIALLLVLIIIGFVIVPLLGLLFIAIDGALRSTSSIDFCRKYVCCFSLCRGSEQVMKSSGRVFREQLCFLLSTQYAFELTPVADGETTATTSGGGGKAGGEVGGNKERLVTIAHARGHGGEGRTSDKDRIVLVKPPAAAELVPTAVDGLRYHGVHGQCTYLPAVLNEQVGGLSGSSRADLRDLAEISPRSRRADLRDACEMASDGF